jgi:hypothetical protein
MTGWSKTCHADILDAQTTPRHQSVYNVKACQSSEISERSSRNMGNINRLGDPQPQSVNTAQSVSRSYTAKETSQIAMRLLGYRTPVSDLVSVAGQQRTVDDGRRCLVQRVEQAEALGWTAQDLFGLNDPGGEDSEFGHLVDHLPLSTRQTGVGQDGNRPLCICFHRLCLRCIFPPARRSNQRSA